MAEEKPMGHMRITKVGPDHSMRDTMGPLVVDQSLRAAITTCWMALPERERSPDRVEKEILRLIQRALKDLKDDAVAFGFTEGQATYQGGEANVTDVSNDRVD